MKKLIYGIFALSLVGALTACGGGQKAAPAPANNAAGGTSSSASGAEGIFKQNCASCHGVDLKGNVGPDLTKIGSKLSKDQILKQIANGSGAMPGGLIKGADADAVATWLAAKK